MDKARMPTATTSIHNSTRSSNQSSLARKGNKSHPNGKGRSKIISVADDMTLYM